MTIPGKRRNGRRKGRTRGQQVLTEEDVILTD